MNEQLTQELKNLEEKLKGKLDSETKAMVEAQIAKVNDSINAEVKKLNDELAAKGATIKQVQDEVKEMQAKAARPGSGTIRMLSLKEIIGNAIEKSGDAFQRDAKKEGGISLDTKTVGDMTTANLTGDYYHTILDWRPGMRPTGQFRVRDLVRTINSATDYVQFPRQAATPGEGSFGQQAAEGDAKSQVDYDFAMVDVTLKAIAGYATVSRQSLRNIPFLRTFLPETMMEDLLDKEDTLFSASLVAAAAGSTTSTGGNEIEKLVHYIRNLRKEKYSPNAIAVDPDVWANLILNISTNAGYNLPNVVAVDPSGTVRVLGRPVYEVNWLTGGNVLVGDFSKAAIVESEGLNMRQSDSHASQFVSNEITFLLERVEEIAIFKPQAFVTADLIA